MIQYQNSFYIFITLPIFQPLSALVHVSLWKWLREKKKKISSFLCSSDKIHPQYAVWLHITFLSTLNILITFVKLCPTKVMDLLQFVVCAYRQIPTYHSIIQITNKQERKKRRKNIYNKQTFQIHSFQQHYLPYIQQRLNSRVQMH